MRTFLVILTTALLTALGLIYARTSNAFPEFFSLLPLPSYVSEQTGTGTISPTGVGCTTPRGDQVAHGEVFLSFASATWTIADGWCESRSTVCINGSRSVDQEPLEHKTCALETPKTCDVGWFIFAHGTSQEFFKIDETTQTCTSETRTCTDGEVDGDETYTSLSCPSSCPTPSTTGATGAADCPACPCLEEKPEIKQPTPPVLNSKPVIKQVTQPTASTSLSEPNCPAPFWGIRREPGQQGTAYKQAVAPYGSTCEQVNIVCAFWSIRYGTKGNAGDLAVWLSTTCRVAEPVACDSACGTIENGSQVTTYSQAIIPNGNGQVCADVKIVSTCTNGTLSPAGWSACGCQIAPPAACTAPNGQTIPHDSSLTLYEYAQVQAVPGDGADTCVRQWRQCKNGTFTDRNGNPAAFTFKHETCTVIAPPTWWGPGGAWVPVGW